MFFSLTGYNLRKWFWSYIEVYDNTNMNEIDFFDHRGENMTKIIIITIGRTIFAHDSKELVEATK